MERTSSKRGLLMETTSYDQDLSAHSNPVASSSQSSTLCAMSSSTPLDEAPLHPLASTEPQPEKSGFSESYNATKPMPTSRQQHLEEKLIRESILLSPSAVSLSNTQQQHHINLTETEALLRRAQETGLLDTLNSIALPQLQSLLAASLTNKLQGDSTNPVQQQAPHFSHPVSQNLQLSHQYNLTTINERSSSNGTPEDGYGAESISIPPGYHREGNNTRTSPGTGANGFGTSYSGGVTSLTGPSPVQQVIGALQDASQTQEHQKRLVKKLHIS